MVEQIFDSHRTKGERLYGRLFIIIVFISIALICGSAGAVEHPSEGSNSRGIEFNFVDVEIPTIVRFMSEITGYNFVFDERVKGKVTIIAPSRLTIEESFSLFTSVLSLKGFTTVQIGAKTYKIIPSSLVKQEGLMPSKEGVPVNAEYMTKLISLKHISAEEAVQFLRPIVSRDGYISAFGQRNFILLVDSGANIKKIMTLLEFIDRPGLAMEESEINVYFLKHADAEELAKVLQGIIKEIQSSYRQLRTRKRKGLSPPLISVTPDKSTNSLIIVAPPSDYQKLIKVIKELDRKRKQVYVEAMIVEASLDKLHELGSKWRAMVRSNGEPIVISGFGTISSDTVLDIISGLSGFTAGGMGNFMDIPVTTISTDGSVTTQSLTAPGFAALFSLNEFRDAVNVLSTPQILTSDNEEAEIIVGENVPFISQRERSVTTSNTVLNSIERTDVGIKLKITPQITQGEYVKLDIFQEISAVKDTPEDILVTVGPTTTKRSTRTSVIVKDGHTVVIGGLMQEREENSTNKVPLLGDIPVVGWLFKYRNVSKTKTNLLVFLSPHIIKEAEDLSEITRQKHHAFVRSSGAYYTDEVLVRFDDSVPQERIKEILARLGASVIEYSKTLKTYRVKIRKGTTVDEAIKEFTSLPEVMYAEPDNKIRIPSISGGHSGDTYEGRP